MSKESNRKSDEILDMAVEYFNGLYGLKIIEHIQGCCAEFRNDFGYVTIQILQNALSNEIVLTSTNWEYQIQDFIQSI